MIQQLPTWRHKSLKENKTEPVWPHVCLERYLELQPKHLGWGSCGGFLIALKDTAEYQHFKDH